MRKEKILSLLKDLKDISSLVVNYDHYVLQNKIEVLYENLVISCMINYKEDQVIIACYHGLKILDLITNKIIEIKLENTVSHLTVLSGEFIVGGSYEGYIIMWNDRLEELFKIKAYHIDIRFLNVIYTNKILSGSFNTIDIWNSTGVLEKTFKREDIACNTILRTKDGDRAVTGYLNSEIEIWNPLTGKSEVFLKGHTKRLTSVVILYFNCNNKIVSGSFDQTIRIWNINGTCEKILTYNHSIFTVSILQDKEIIHRGLKTVTFGNIEINDEIRRVLVLNNGKVLFCTENWFLKLIK